MRTDAATVQPTIQNVFAARQERAAHRMPATLEVRRQLDRPRTPSFLRQPQEPHRLLAERLAVHGQPFRPHTAIEVSQDRQVVARSVGHVAEAQDICPGRQGLGPPVDLLGRHACGTAVTAAGGRGLLGIEPGKAQRRRIGVGKDHPGTGSNCGRPGSPSPHPRSSTSSPARSCRRLSHDARATAAGQTVAQYCGSAPRAAAVEAACPPSRVASQASRSGTTTDRVPRAIGSLSRRSG